MAAGKASRMAVASLVLGILGFCCACGFITGIPAVIVGLIERGKIKRGESPPAGKGFATAGIFLGMLSVLLACLVLAIYLIYGVSSFTGAVDRLK